MKKTYVKPELVVESFQLNAANAASCSGDGFVPIGKSETSCMHEAGYFSEAASCLFDETGGDGIYDKICYHGPGMIFLQS